MAVIGLIPQTGQSAIYSWIDAEGVQHFTNTPPPDDVAAFRQSEEIPYDEASDRKGQAEDARYFQTLALQSALKRLAEAEKALAASRNRAQAAEQRSDALVQALENDETDAWGGLAYGGGYIYDPYRPDAGLCRRPGKGCPGGRPPRPELYDDTEADRMAYPRPTPSDRARYDRARFSREPGVTSGLYRVQRALPSPYYFGNRPVYTPRPSYGPRRPGPGRPSHHRGRVGSGGTGARIRISF
jgi:hypothetical protein